MKETPARTHRVGKKGQVDRMKAMKNKRFGVLIGGQDGTYCRQVVFTTGSLERAREIAKTIKGRPVAVVEVIPGRASGSGSMAVLRWV